MIEAIKALKSDLSAMKVGNPAVHENLCVFPLLGGAARTPSYLTLAEAMETGNFTITEVSETGSVPDACASTRRPVRPTICIEATGRGSRTSRARFAPGRPIAVRSSRSTGVSRVSRSSTRPLRSAAIFRAWCEATRSTRSRVGRRSPQLQPSTRWSGFAARSSKPG